jgi:hypothetical protein
LPLCRLVEPGCGYLPAARVLLLRQDFTDSPCIDSVIGGNVMLMLPAPMTEPNVNSFIECEFCLRVGPETSRWIAEFSEHEAD